MEWWYIPAGFVAFWGLFISVTAWLGSDSVPRLNLSRKHALVTGGSDGLGLEVCKLLAQRGCHVTIVARDVKKLEAAAAAVRDRCKYTDQKVLYFSADTTDLEAMKAAAEKARAAHDGVIDILVANAGITHPAAIEDLDYHKHFERIMRVNYFGTVNAIMSVLESMRKRRAGRIVVVNSALGFMSTYGYGAYGPSKFAMRSFVETLHQENYPYGIACTVVASGSIGSKSFFEEEQRVKPEITKLIEADDYVSPPEHSARQLVGAIENWKLIAPVGGFLPWAISIMCHGMSSGSFTELLAVGLVNPLLSPISWVLFNKNCRDIILKNWKPKLD